VASAGAIAALRFSEVPLSIVVAVLLRLIPVTAIELDVTVTAQVSVKEPSSDVAVIIAEPSATAETRPAASTEAMESADDDQLTLAFDALDGVSVAESRSEDPKRMLVEDLFNDRPVTDTDTETEQVAVKPPSFVITVMVADPIPSAVTRPFESTEATAGFELV